MTYATWIAQMRAQSGDIKRRVHVDWIGDGTTNVFQMPDDTFPILDDTSTYAVKVATVTKTETTHYTLDKISGTVTFISTPTNGQAIEFDGIAVYLQDADWLAVANDVIRSLGDDFWREFVDTAHTTTAGMLSLSLVSLQPLAIAIYEWQHRRNTTENWVTVEEYTNWRYDRENNILYIGRNDVFTVTGELFRIRGLKTYTLGTATSDTIDLQDRFLTILEYGALARYWQWRYKHVIELVSKMSQENSRTPLQELIMLSDRFKREYEAEKAKLKPQKPPRVIPRYKEGAGRP